MSIRASPATDLGCPVRLRPRKHPDNRWGLSELDVSFLSQKGPFNTNQQTKETMLRPFVTKYHAKSVRDRQLGAKSLRYSAFLFNV